MPQLHKATNNKRTGPCEWSFAYPPSGKCAAAELQKRCMPGRLECRPKQNIAVMAVSFPKALPNQRAQRLNLKFTCRACQRQVPTISTALILCNPRSKLPNFIPCLVPLSEMLHKFHDLLSCDISSTPCRVLPFQKRLFRLQVTATTKSTLVHIRRIWVSKPQATKMQFCRAVLARRVPRILRWMVCLVCTCEGQKT